MISGIAHLAQPALSNQQIADFMLSADRDRRKAIRDGDFDRAIELHREIGKLESQIR